MPTEPVPGLDRDVETADLERDERQEGRTARRARFWWQRRRVEPEKRDETLGQLFYEGDRHRPYLYRFTVLQSSAVVVAVLGVLGGSPAIVIGAMLLAPLMTPVLALAAALVMIWPRRVLRSALLVLVATVASVGLAWVVAHLLPHPGVGGLPTELLSRTNPSVLDLVVALAAGVAGGYSLVREELGTSLPGVAVAVALVPPLAVAGAAFEIGRSDLAWGAALLYLVNLAAIVFAAGAVFIVTGFIPAVRVARMTTRVVGAIALSAMALVAVTIPLTHGLQEAVDADAVRSIVSGEVATWLEDRPITVEAIDVDGSDVAVHLVAEVPPPSAQSLQERLEQRLGRSLVVEVTWVELHREVAPGG